jgi:hypothetical protein
VIYSRVEGKGGKGRGVPKAEIKEGQHNFLSRLSPYMFFHMRGKSKPQQLCTTLPVYQLPMKTLINRKNERHKNTHTHTEQKCGKRYAACNSSRCT